jgi:hypothetical protein
MPEHLCSDPPLAGSGSPNGTCWYKYNGVEWVYIRSTNLAQGYTCRPSISAPPPSPGDELKEVPYRACKPG